jgi:hypothetical protein
MSPPEERTTAMSDREYHFIDADGIDVWVRPSADHENTALVSTYSESFAVRAHELAGFTRAVWAAAKQPPPDLPVIHDPAAVEELTADLKAQLDEDGDVECISWPVVASRLLDAGWRKP